MSKHLLWIPLAAMIFLTGCIFNNDPIIRHKYIRQEVPASVIPDCPERPFTGETIGDRLVWADDIKADGDECRAEIKGLEEWLEGDTVEEE